PSLRSAVSCSCAAPPVLSFPTRRSSDLTRWRALPIRDVAISSIALKIFFIDAVESIFWRKTRISAADMLFLSVTYSWCRMIPAPWATGRSAFLADDLFLFDRTIIDGIVFLVARLNQGIRTFCQVRFLEVGDFLNQYVFNVIADESCFSNGRQRNVVQP